MAGLASLDIGDTAATWSSLGFVVEGDQCAIDGVIHRLRGPDTAPGVSGWWVEGTDLGEGVEGLPMGGPPADVTDPNPAHPNGVIEIDHLVISTPDLGRTIANFEGLGWSLRRTRDAGRAHQAFFKLGPVILEVVGPMQPAGDGPARFFGLAFTVSDLDVTAEVLGDKLRPAKDAVQPGRRIATLDRDAGSTVAIAFMTPEP